MGVLTDPLAADSSATERVAASVPQNTRDDRAACRFNWGRREYDANHR